MKYMYSLKMSDNIHISWVNQSVCIVPDCILTVTFFLTIIVDHLKLDCKCNFTELLLAELQTVLVGLEVEDLCTRRRPMNTNCPPLDTLLPLPRTCSCRASVRRICLDIIFHLYLISSVVFGDSDNTDML